MKKNFLKLLHRVFAFRAFKFDGCHLFLWGVPMIHLPYGVLCDLQQSLKEEFGLDEAYSILYQLGKLQGINGSNILIKRYNFKVDIRDLSFFLEQTRLVGIGVYSMSVRRDGDRIAALEFDNTDAAQSRIYRSIYGEVGHATDHYQTGLITGACEAVVFKEPTIGFERLCLAKGDRFCRHVVMKRSSNADEVPQKALVARNLPEIEKYAKFENVSRLISPLNIQSVFCETVELLKKRGLKPVSFVAGKVEIFGNAGVLTPMDVLVLMHLTLSSRHPQSFRNVFLRAGVKAGKRIFNTFYGDEKMDINNINHLKKIVELPALMGFGKVQVVHMGRKKILLRVLENPFAKLYRSLDRNMGVGVDDYLSGILKGLIESFFSKEGIVVKETACAVSGKPFCSFTVQLP